MGKDAAAEAAIEKDRGAEGEQLELFKEYLAEPRFRIKLDDLVNATVREATQRTAADKFPPVAQVKTGEDVSGVLKAYEEAIRPTQSFAVLLGKWATAEQRSTLANMVARLSDPCVKGYGWNAHSSAFQWYPISLLMYSAGIASLSSENYAAFAAVHAQKIDSKTKRIGSTAVPILVPAVDAMLDLAQANVWSCIPGQAGRNTPESHYRFKALKPALDGLLFLGSSYDPLFDHYEILRTWMYADFTESEWAPVGRYAEQHGGLRSKGNPYHELRAEAEAQRDQWWPIRVGLFRGSYARFEQSVAKIEKVFLSKLNGFG